LTLIFSDLFTYERRSIAHLQVFKSDGAEAVALVTEPSDNPGRGCVNDAERLCQAILRAFQGLGDIDIFVRFLNDPNKQVWIKLKPAADGMDFERDVSVGEVEKLCPDAARVSWDMVDHSCMALGGANHPLLALIPEPEPERDPLDDLAVVAVADLPWAHNPFKCAHVERFETIEGLYVRERWPPPAAGAQWFLTLTEEDFKACDRHDADWLAIAAVSVEIYRGLEAEATMDTVRQRVTARFGDTSDAFHCVTLFRDPITWRPGQTRVGDGQHRTCALKAAGAPFCIAETGGHQRTELVGGDPARRASAEVAQYWMRRAAE